MTKEIAKRIVRGITDKIEATTDIDDWAEFWGFTRDDYEEFLEMAIKALEQEPCGDVISRQAVAEVLLKYAHSAEGKAFAEFLISQINNLPPITPQYTDTEIQKMQDLESVEIQTAYEIGKDEGSEVLDKIRAELHSTAEMHQDGGYYVRDEWIDEIFDKYKAESEVQDAGCD